MTRIHCGIRKPFPWFLILSAALFLWYGAHLMHCTSPVLNSRAVVAHSTPTYPACGLKKLLRSQAAPTQSLSAGMTYTIRSDPLKRLRLRAGRA